MCSGRPPSLARFHRGKELGMLGRQLYEDCANWLVGLIKYIWVFSGIFGKERSVQK